MPPPIEREPISGASRAVARAGGGGGFALPARQGTSLGGLRPKCTIVDEHGRLVIGKLPSAGDTRGEVLALRRAAQAGIGAVRAQRLAGRQRTRGAGSGCPPPLPVSRIAAAGLARGRSPLPSAPTAPRPPRMWAGCAALRRPSTSSLFPGPRSGVQDLAVLGEAHAAVLELAPSGVQPGARFARTRTG